MNLAIYRAEAAKICFYTTYASLQCTDIKKLYYPTLQKLPTL